MKMQQVAYHFAAGTGIGYECIDPVQGPYAKLAGPVLRHLFVYLIS